jgi:adenylate kinase family enzyme
MVTSLFLVEGLPGSGKTTTAEALTRVLQNQQINTRLHIEGDLNHPADYESIAYLTMDEWTDFQSKYASLDVLRFAEVFNDYVLISYRQWQSKQDVPEAVLAFLQARDIYELPFELYQSMIFKKWEAFVAQALTTDTTYVFECCFLQNPLTMGLIKYDLPKETLRAYINRLATIIAPLQPVLVYVDQPDVERSFRRALNERPPEWADGFVSYYTEQAYGVNRSLSGVEGTIAILRERKALEHQLLKTLPFRVEVFGNEDFSTDVRQKWLNQLIQSTVRSISLSES